MNQSCIRLEHIDPTCLCTSLPLCPHNTVDGQLAQLALAERVCNYARFLAVRRAPGETFVRFSAGFREVWVVVGEGCSSLCSGFRREEGTVHGKFAPRRPARRRLGLVQCLGAEALVTERDQTC